MPSVSRGLYKWVYQRAAVLEDFADRLNHFWTVGLLLVLACVISWKHNYGDPIKCWCPAEFTNTFVDYTNSLCWNSYTIEYPKDVEEAYELLGLNVSRSPFLMSFVIPFSIVFESPPQLDSSLLQKASNTVTMYQWFPLILCLQAMLFKRPNIIMYAFHGFTGVSFDKIAGLTAGFDALDLKEGHTLGKQVARYIYRWCSSCAGCLPCRLLTVLWLLVKILFCFNIIVQTAILDKYLTTKDPPIDNSTSYWSAISGNLYENNATLWKTSPHFPRKILCDFSIIQLANLQRFTVQCQLPANEFNERVYAFLWVWFVFVAVVTSLSALVWMIPTLVPLSRKRYITKALDIADDLEFRHRPDVGRFCDIIGEDGVMVLKLVSANSSELLVRDVICSMWSMWKEKPDDIKAEKAGLEIE